MKRLVFVAVAIGVGAILVWPRADGQAPTPPTVPSQAPGTSAAVDQPISSRDNGAPKLPHAVAALRTESDESETRDWPPADEGRWAPAADLPPLPELPPRGTMTTDGAQQTAPLSAAEWQAMHEEVRPPPPLEP